jgi:sn-glycerol 3-phosphate transport system substrate-binding protein
MKKVLCLMLSALMALSATACSNGSNAAGSQAEQTSTQSQAAKGEKVKVAFWHAMGSSNGDRLNEMVKRFNESQDKVEVIATNQGSYEEEAAKIQTAIAGNNAPDITQIERAFVEPFATNGILTDLNPYLNKIGMKSDDFVQGLMGYSFYNDDGKLYSIPFTRSTPILYYNKDAYKEVGLDPNKGPDNWEELKEYAKKLTKKENGKTVRYGITWPIATWYFKANVAQIGGRTISEDKKTIGFYENGTGLRVLKMWLDLRDSGYFKVTPVKDGANIARQSFINGESAMFQESTALIGTLKKNCKFEIGAAMLPGEDKRAMPTGGANIGILEASKNKDAAWEFINWFINDENGGLKFVLDTGYLPFTKKMAESDTVQNLWKESPMYKVAYDQLQYAVDTEQHTYWSEMKAQILNMEQAVMNDNKDPQQALDDLYAKSKQILGQ